MSLGPETIFTKLSADAATKLLVDLVKAKGELLAKVGAEDDLVPLKTLANDGDWNLVASLTKANPSLGAQIDEATLTTQLGGEKYFMTGSLLRRNDGLWTLQLGQNIFQLQRRQHFRLRLPESYQARFELASLNGAPSKLSATVHDLSEGGCRLFLPHNRPELKSEDTITGELQMGTKAPLAIKGKVRHIKKEKLPTESQLVGVQFLELTPALENRLFSLVMELHRQFFARKD